MALDEWKASLAQLSQAERKELRDFLNAMEGIQSGTAPAQPQPSGQSGTPWLKPVAVISFFLIVAAAVGWGIGEWKRQVNIQERALVIQERSRQEAEEANRPRSPTNLEYLQSRIGKEVTVRGIPRKSEVGLLYFASEPSHGLIVEVFEPHVVLYQSSQLDAWVKNQTELEINGILQIDPKTSAPMINITKQNQIRVVDS